MADLPLDITETILTRLPVKSLLRFESVSKSWQGTILNPRFAKLHIQVSQNSSQNLFFLSESTPVPDDPGSGRFRLVKLENQQFQTEAELTFPFGSAATLSCCNGVVLLMKVDTPKSIFVLCNPSNRMHRTILCPYKYVDYRSTNYGLCYDPTLDDYKIVINSRKKYMVYSSKKDTWTSKKNILHNILHGDINEARGVFINGAFYWVIHGSEEYKREILKFDVLDDKFTKLKKPTDIKDNDKIFLTKLRGCLCLYTKWRDMKEVQVWMMEHQSWRRLITIEDLHLRALHTRFARPVCFTNENDILITISRSRFVTYSLCDKKFGEIHEYPPGWRPPLVPCLDSLFFPVQSISPEKMKKRTCLI